MDPTDQLGPLWSLPINLVTAGPKKKNTATAVSHQNPLCVKNMVWADAFFVVFVTWHWHLKPSTQNMMREICQTGAVMAVAGS